MADCPRCEATLSRPHECGSCGWKSRTRKSVDQHQTRPHAHCAVETCSTSAFCRIQTAHGWAEFCETHYELHFANQSRQRAVELGLTRRADETHTAYRKRMMAYLRANARVKTFDDAIEAEEQWSAEPA